MTDHSDLFRLLREALADCYPQVSLARLFAGDAGLNLAAIDFAGPALVYWQDILAEADRKGKVEVLLHLAIKQAPARRELTDLLEQYRAWSAEGSTLIEPRTTAAETQTVPAVRDAGRTLKRWRLWLLVGLALVAAPVTFILVNRLEKDSAAPIAAPPATPVPPITKMGPNQMVLVYVPAGPFTMGSKNSDITAWDEERPQHQVHVEGFWISRSEVTNAQYAHCVTAGACPAPENTDYERPEFADRPVTHVSWYNAHDYAAWIGGRLPTEAEWEKACRGIDARAYPWGNYLPTAELLNYANNIGLTTEVGSYPRGTSPYGLFDMAGNVSEWTASLSKPYPYQADDGRNAEGENGARMLRGGSWSANRWVARCAYRFEEIPGSSIEDLGFRVVVVSDADSPATELTPIAPTLTTMLTTNPISVPEAGTLAIGPNEMALVYVPAGPFTMGSSATDPDAEDREKPQHQVDMEAFWISRTEVTNAQYIRCMEAGACLVPDNTDYQQPEKANEPVGDVTWHHANAYARWVGGRLPTEAEWEKACRGQDVRIYPWGEAAPTGELLSFGSREAGVKEVSSFPQGASPYGLFDMAGNVWEWTSSGYRNYPYRADDGREGIGEETRVFRGGAYLSAPSDVRCAARFARVPNTQGPAIGFRVVAAPLP